MKILCVDDFRTIHKIVSNALKPVGMEIITASNGVDALRILEEQNKEIALILLDWNMPEMSGIDCLKKIGQSPQLKRIPVIMLTSEDEPDKIAEALRSGASNYITKPFASEDLLSKVLHCLGRTS